MKRFLFVIVTLALCSLPASAFKFYPITADLAPNGPQAGTTFTATNDGPETIALRITLWIRTQNADGADELLPADADFAIYPARLALKPSEAQRIRIQYRGKPVSGTENAYRILVEQLPVDFSPGTDTGGLRILYKYIGSIYVFAGTPVPGVRVVRCERRADPSGERLVVFVENTGTGHAILVSPKLSLTDGISSGAACTGGARGAPGLEYPCRSDPTGGAALASRIEGYPRGES